MQADHVLRATGHCRDSVDVKAGRIAGQNRAGFADFVQGAEYLLLDLHLLEDRLDHQVRISQVGVIERARK
ncbi:hypothetical protein D3C76_1447800 [compost metagenome]